MYSVFRNDEIPPFCVQVEDLEGDPLDVSTPEGRTPSLLKDSVTVDEVIASITPSSRLTRTPDEEDTPLGVRCTAKGMRVLTGVKAPKRRASASPRDVESEKPSEGAEDGSSGRRWLRETGIVRPDLDRSEVGVDDSPVRRLGSVGCTAPKGAGFVSSKRTNYGERKARCKNTKIMVISSNDEEVKKDKGKKKPNKRNQARRFKRKRTEMPSISGAIREISSEGSGLNDTIGPPDMVAMSAAALGAAAFEWVEEIETYRLKSINLQGAVSGEMKSRLVKVGNAIRTLVGKAEAFGDPSYLRSRAKELTRQLQELKKDNEEIRRALRDSEKRIQDLQKNEKDRNIENSRSDGEYENMDAGDVDPDDARAISHRVLLKHGLEPVTELRKPVMRPSLRGMSVAIPESPVEEMIALTDKSRREIELTSQIDALVKTRRDIREDIVRMADGICDPVPEAGELPPRRTTRGPVVVSDVQLVPPRTKALLSDKRMDKCVHGDSAATTDDGAGSNRPGVEDIGTDSRHASRAAKRDRKRERET